MTKHRIAADKEESLLDQRSHVVIEDDRRRRFQGVFPFTGEKRATTHNYSEKHKIIYVPVDLPVECKNYKYLGTTITPGFHGKHQFEMLDCDMPAFYFADSPFHPDDTLILLEEWHEDHLKVLTEEIKLGAITIPAGVYPQRLYLRSEYEPKFPNAGWIWNPAEDMPPELDSQCQQYNVVKVLGVELRASNLQLRLNSSETTWNWKLLTREQ